MSGIHFSEGGLNREETSTFDGVLLAGGHSRRMGQDKACLSLPSGEVLWRRQWALLETSGASRRWLSVRPEQTWPPADVERVSDRVADGGPLDGIVAAWDRSDATHLLVLAVDLPNLPVAWFTRLRQACAPGAGAVGRSDDGRFEPLAAIYPRTWLTEWATALGAGRRSLQHLVRLAAERSELAVVPIQADRAAWFHNLNRPEDLVGV